MRRHPIIAAHGGAGSRAMTASQRACLEDALAAGHDALRRGGEALDAVESTIRVLEGSGLFNAGVGSRRQLDGVQRMDASLMEGKDLRAGAVAAIQGIRHPITAARLVMQETNHVLLVGQPATRFARHFKIERLPTSVRSHRDVRRTGRETASLRKMFKLYRAMYGHAGLGTVGAVAIDGDGNVAAGASTGGVAFMLPGRVGDTPLIGSGVYADNAAGAVSMTGIGEGIIRIGMAKEIVQRLGQGAGPTAAVTSALQTLASRVHGEAGALVLDTAGRIAIRHTTLRMAAGYCTGQGRPIVADRFNRLRMDRGY